MSWGAGSGRGLRASPFSVRERGRRRPGHPRPAGRARRSPRPAPGRGPAGLERAATAFERATRSRIAADHASAHVLRRSVQEIWRNPPPHGDGAGLAMLLDAVLTAVAFAAHWLRTRQHAQQEAAAEQALVHLQTAYVQIAGPVLDNLATRPASRPSAATPTACSRPYPSTPNASFKTAPGTPSPRCSPRRKQRGATRPRSSTKPQPAHSGRRPQSRRRADLAYPAPRPTPRTRPSRPGSKALHTAQDTATWPPRQPPQGHRR